MSAGTPPTRHRRPGARISLFVGKGGVGKSTLATATAVRDARAGLRVLIVSTDQAHSIGDVLGTTVTPTGRREPTRVLADSTRTPAAGSSTRSPWTPWRCWRPGGARSPGCSPIDSPSRTWEILHQKNFRRCLAFRRCSVCTRWVSWRTLGSGITSSWTARRPPMRCGCSRCPRRSACTWSAPGRGTAGCRRRRRRALGGGGRAAGTDRRGHRAARHPAHRRIDRVSAHLVLTAERVVAAEAVRTLGSLALMGVQVAELIVNQILVQDDSYEYRNLPEHPAFDWYSERISEQRVVLDELDRDHRRRAAGAGAAPRG